MFFDAVSASVVEVGFTQLVYSVREDEESVQLLITKSGANVRDVSVAFTTKDGTAMSKRNDWSGKLKPLRVCEV